MRYRKPEELKKKDVERVAEVPRDWDLIKLKWVCSVYSGESINNSLLTEDGDFPVYGGNGIMSYANKKNCITRTIIIGRVGAQCGNVHITNQNSWITDNALIVKVRRYFDLKYLSKLLESISLNDLSTSTAQPLLTASKIKNLYVTRPSFKEQRSIATFLDRKTEAIDSLIQKKEQLIERLKEKRQALITQAVTKGLDPDVPMKDSGIEWLGEIPEEWEVTKTKWLVSKIGSGKTPRGGSEVYKDEGIPFIRSQNIHFDGLRLDDVVYINEEIHEDMKSTAIKPNDVLLNITGASIGRASLVPNEFPKANLNQHVCILRPRKENISPDFLHLVVSSDLIQNQIFAFENGTSREGLNFSQVGSLLMSLPPLDEQKNIVRKVRKYEDRIFSLSTDIENQIEQLKEYRQSLISAAVTGKIDVRDEVEIESKEVMA